MRIGNGSQISSTQTGLLRTTSAIAKALTRLSTGQRVSRPGDDIAAHSVSVGLESQIRGLTQGLRNINEAKGTLISADSALNSQVEIVQRMREIALQASSSTMSMSERTNLQSELQSLLSQYQRIADSTSALQTSIQLTGSADGQMDFNLQTTAASEVFQETVGTGSFNSRTSFSQNGASGAVVTGDFNNDGKQDLFISSTSIASLFLGNGDGTFQAAVTVDMDGAATTPSAVDINNDGNLDLIATGGSSGSFASLIGNGDGTFQTVRTFSGSVASQVGTGDYNGDGNLDVITYEGSSYQTYLGDGEGEFTADQSAGIGFFIPKVALVDVNGDGKDDLVYQDFSELRYELWDGTGFTGGGAGFGVAGGAFVVADVDDDGDQDFAVTQFFSGGVDIVVNHGDLSFSTNAVSPSGSGTTDVQFADINRDGIKDMINLSDSDGILEISFGTGSGNFSVATSQSVVTGFSNFLGVADFNGDGVSDVITNNSSGGNFDFYSARTRAQSALSDIDIRTQSQAESLIEILDTTLENLESRRSEVTALHSRLDSAAVSNLLIRENYQDAKSNLLDADFALETAEMVRLQILQQAQVAVSAQANLSAQLVLRLLY